MFDFDAILKSIQDQAGKVADAVDVDTRVEEAKSVAKDVRERLETDPKAQAVALGGGAVLALLLASRGGRSVLGNVAKTGAVAGLGALAYKAWQNHQANSESGGEATFEEPDLDDETAFNKAIIETMIAAAQADGHMANAEHVLIEDLLPKTGLDPATLKTDMSPEEAIDRVASVAKTPNQAAHLFAAACSVTAESSALEDSFLAELADRLAIHPRKAAEMRAAIA